jgi:hypothetical protein
MLQRFGSTAFLAGTLLTALIPAVSLARDHDGNSGGGHSSPSGRSARSNSNSGQIFSGRSRNYAPRSFSGGSRYYGGQSFVSPRGSDGRRGYSGGASYYGRGYIAPRSYGWPVYRGDYNGGLYLGYGAPYGYAYDPGYVYDSGYAYDPGYTYGPTPAPQACADGSYDRYLGPKSQLLFQSTAISATAAELRSQSTAVSAAQQNYDPDQPQRYNR